MHELRLLLARTEAAREAAAPSIRALAAAGAPAVVAVLERGRMLPLLGTRLMALVDEAEVRARVDAAKLAERARAIRLEAHTAQLAGALA